MIKIKAGYLWMAGGLLICATSVFGQETTKAQVEEKPKEETVNKEQPGEKTPTGITAKLYGFLKGDYHRADGAILSFGHENLATPTSAKRATQFDDKEPRTQLIFHNSRLGVVVGDGKRISGKLELDFQGGFDKSQANTSVGTLRLRQAIVNYKATEWMEIFAGQMWDIFSPQGPLANYNIVAWQLGAGNVGMMTERAGFSFDLHKSVNLKVALGNTNANALDEPIVKHEIGNRPVYTALLTVKPTDSIKFNLSGIYADIVHQNKYIEQSIRAGDPLLWDPRDYQSTMTDVLYAWEQGLQMPASVTNGYPYKINIDGGKNVLKPAKGVSLGTDITLKGRINFALEAYYGENLGDLRTIALGKAQKRMHSDKIQDTALGRVDPATASVELRRYIYFPMNTYESIYEAGAWAAGKYKILSVLSLAHFVGISKILNPQALASPHATSGSYTNIEALTRSIAFDGDSASTMGNVEKNLTYGFNIGIHPHPNLTFYIQVQRFETTYHDGERITMWRHIRSINATTGAATLVDTSDYVDNMQIPDKKALATDITFGTMLKF